MHKGKITQIGNSAGLILPKETLDRLGVKKGDEIFYVPTKNGIEITPYDPELERQMEAAKIVMKENRSVLKKLAEGAE